MARPVAQHGAAKSADGGAGLRRAIAFGGGAHDRDRPPVVNPVTGRTAAAVLPVAVVAPSAMVAKTVATAAAASARREVSHSPDRSHWPESASAPPRDKRPREVIARTDPRGTPRHTGHPQLLKSRIMRKHPAACRARRKTSNRCPTGVAPWVRESFGYGRLSRRRPGRLGRGLREQEKDKNKKPTRMVVRCVGHLEDGNSAYLGQAGHAGRGRGPRGRAAGELAVARTVNMDIQGQ